MQQDGQHQQPMLQAPRGLFGNDSQLDGNMRKEKPFVDHAEHRVPEHQIPDVDIMQHQMPIMPKEPEEYDPNAPGMIYIYM